jgi:hypothetical protein
VCIAKRSQVGLSILSTIFCMRIHQYAGIFLSHSSNVAFHMAAVSVKAPHATLATILSFPLKNICDIPQGCGLARYDGKGVVSA